MQQHVAMSCAKRPNEPVSNFVHGKSNRPHSAAIPSRFNGHVIAHYRHDLEMF
jgi:hypothetical protein